MRRRRLTALASATALGFGLAAALPALPAHAETVQALQWHLAALRITEVHKLSTGAGVVVAVIDTGTQATHPDLAGRVLPGVKITGDDDKGQIDGVDHGTGVAGIIAAKGGAPDHAMGIAPDAKILPVKIHTGQFGPTDAPAGIRWAVDHGAKVINLSIGGAHTNDDYTAAVRYALDHDVVVVAAAGNTPNGDVGVQYPAKTPGVIAVSAVDRTGASWSGSVHGPEVALAAPGVDIETLANHFSDGKPGGYVKGTGTSASAPMVAGAAALIRSKYPQLHVADVVNRLVATADDAGPPGRDEEYGFGRLDIVKALTADVPHVDRNPLGYPDATPSTAAAAPSHDSFRLSGTTIALLVGLAVLALLVLVALVVVMLVVLRRRSGPRGGVAVPPGGTPYR